MQVDTHRSIDMPVGWFDVGGRLLKFHPSCMHFAGNECLHHGRKSEQGHTESCPA